MSDEKSQKAGLKKKGGTMFPRISLEEAARFASKLVSKTHVSAHPREIIYPGVFGSSGPPGEIRASALKQFGFLEGKSDAIKASELAKAYVAAPKEDKSRIAGAACRKPKVFALLFETFKGDKVSIARLRQQASQAGVHPEMAETCAKLFASSVAFAELGTLEDDELTLQPSTVADSPANESEVEEESQIDADVTGQPAGPANSIPDVTQQRARTGNVQVSLNIDSSMDADKLERQLQLLRKYGAL